MTGAVNQIEWQNKLRHRFTDDQADPFLTYRVAGCEVKNKERQINNPFQLNLIRRMARMNLAQSYMQMLEQLTLNFCIQ